MESIPKLMIIKLPFSRHFYAFIPCKCRTSFKRIKCACGMSNKTSFFHRSLPMMSPPKSPEPEVFDIYVKRKDQITIYCSFYFSFFFLTFTASLSACVAWAMQCPPQPVCGNDVQPSKVHFFLVFFCLSLYASLSACVACSNFFLIFFCLSLCVPLRLCCMFHAMSPATRLCFFHAAPKGTLFLTNFLTFAFVAYFKITYAYAIPNNC